MKFIAWLLKRVQYLKGNSIVKKRVRSRSYKIIVLGLVLFLQQSLHAIPEKEIVVLIPSYNNARWFKKNIDSAVHQHYSNFHVYYVDDCSPDGTGDLVRDYIKQNHLEDQVTLIANPTRVGAMANIYNNVHTFDDEKLIVLLDGDDWFAHENVLSLIINTYFIQNDIWFAYGQYINVPKKIAQRIGLTVRGGARETPLSVIKNKSYRFGPWIWSGCRVFYAGLFKRIRRADLCYPNTNNFFKVGYDMAIIWPMLEMAGIHIKYISEVILERNVETPINDFKINKQEQMKINWILKGRRKYPCLEFL